jgi:mono/diheme cytochrome c family protein
MHIKSCGLAMVVSVWLVPATITPALADNSSASNEQLQRGRYLVEYGGCSDCHTPKLMTDKGPVPDPARALSGYPASMPQPPIPAGVLGPPPGHWSALTNADLTAWAGPWGVSFTANLTPDKATGLGHWTVDQFIKTMRTGKHLGTGRDLLPPMPWQDVAVLTDRDLRAIFAYLRTMPPIVNAVPQPLPPK